MEVPTDERGLVAALLAQPPLSRNRHFELLSSDVGRRARRRAAFLRSIADDIERVRERRGAVQIERGAFARGAVRLALHHGDYVRRVYLSEEEVALVARVSLLVASVLELGAAE